MGKSILIDTSEYIHNHSIEQLISTLVISPSNDLLEKISSFLVKAKDNDDANQIILTSFQSLHTLEQWAWKVLSRDCRQWDQDEQSYFELFSNLLSLNMKIIFSDIVINTKESLLVPTTTDVIDGVLQQVQKRQNENDRFLTIVFRWLDNLSLLMYRHNEFALSNSIIYLIEKLVSTFLMTDEFKSYINQLQDSSSKITERQKFYLITCVSVLCEYVSTKPHQFPLDALQLLDYFAQDYMNIISIHTQKISSWNKELLSCVSNLSGLIAACYHWIGDVDQIIESLTHLNKVKYDYIKSLIQILSHRAFHETTSESLPTMESMLINNITQILNYLIDSPSILHFCCTQKRLIDTLLRLSQLNDEQLDIRIVRLLFEILPEKQIKKLSMYNKINRQSHHYLRYAWQNPLKAFNRIPVEQILKVILITSKTGAPKTSIETAKQLELLIEMSDHYPIVYDILWSLSFDIRVQQEFRLKQSYLKKLEGNCAKQHLQDCMQGIEWNLDPDRIRLRMENNDLKHVFDIMISCSLDDLPWFKNLYKELVKDEFRVWVSSDTSCNKSIHEIIKAVEQSRVIIICLSRQYKLSDHCRAEAEYAFRKRLKIVPILIEDHYEPDGWILSLIHGSLEIDFSHREFSSAMKDLLNELKSPGISVIDSLVVRQQPQNITNSSVSNLSSEDIHHLSKYAVESALSFYGFGFKKRINYSEEK